MNIKHLIVASLMAVAAPCVAQTISPIAKAMLDAYTEILQEDPNDYLTLYQRGAQYHAMSMYDQALADVTRAIEFTPAKEKEMLVDEYSLLADISIELERYPVALEAIDKALEISPADYANLYKRGNICLYLKQPEEAYKSFQALQRLKSRSQEAFFGMAKADAMMGKEEEAKEFMKQAEAADPTNYITFCRLGDICMDMNDHDGAAANYLSAFGLADDTSRPVASLFVLSEKDFPAVANAIDYAISKSSKTLPLYFLKGNLASAAGNYQEAYNAFKSVLESGEGKEASVYQQLADVCYALNMMSEADTNAGISLSMAEVPETLILKSRINLAQGNAAFALSNATKAASLDPASADALVAVALANIALDDNKAALAALNEAVMNDAANTEALMIRAWLNSNKLDNEKGATADYARVALVEAKKPADIRNKALAQTLSGKKLDGDSTMVKALAADSSKEMLYNGAVYYAQTGNLDRAKELLNQAKRAGYQHQFNLESNQTANLTIAPIR